MKTPHEAERVQPTLLSIADLATLLGVSSRHVERMDVSGRMPAPVRLGRSKRWRRTEIESWIVAGCPDRAAWRAAKKGGVA